MLNQLALIAILCVTSLVLSHTLAYIERLLFSAFMVLPLSNSHFNVVKILNIIPFFGIFIALYPLSMAQIRNSTVTLIFLACSVLLRSFLSSNLFESQNAIWSWKTEMGFMQKTKTCNFKLLAEVYKDYSIRFYEHYSNKPGKYLYFVITLCTFFQIVSEISVVKNIWTTLDSSLAIVSYMAFSRPSLVYNNPEIRRPMRKIVKDSFLLLLLILFIYFFSQICASAISAHGIAAFKPQLLTFGILLIMSWKSFEFRIEDLSQPVAQTLPIRGDQNIGGDRFRDFGWSGYLREDISSRLIVWSSKLRQQELFHLISFFLSLADLLLLFYCINIL